MADELFPRKEEEASNKEEESTSGTGTSGTGSGTGGQKEGQDDDDDIQKELQDEINQLQEERQTNTVEPEMNLTKKARKRAFRQGRFAHLNFGIQAITLIVCLVRLSLGNEFIILL